MYKYTTVGRPNQVLFIKPDQRGVPCDLKILDM